MQHATPTIEPSDEQLRAAWRAMAKPDWGTLEDAARAASHFNLVRAFARRQAMGVRPEASVAAQAELANAERPAPGRHSAWICCSSADRSGRRPLAHWPWERESARRTRRQRRARG